MFEEISRPHGQVNHEHAMRQLRELRGTRTVEELERENATLKSQLDSQSRELSEARAAAEHLRALTSEQGALLRLQVCAM